MKKKLSINQANNFYLEVEIDRILKECDLVEDVVKEVKELISHFTMTQHYTETLH